MAHEAQLQAKMGEAKTLVTAQVKRLRETGKAAPADPALTDEVKKTLQGFREENAPSDDQLAKLAPAFEPAAREKLMGLQKEIMGLQKSFPPAPERAMALVENDKKLQGARFQAGQPK